MRGRIRDERGAVVIFIAVAFVGLLALTAFVIDLGRLYSVRRELQKTADASAFAAAAELASPGAVTAEGVLYGQLNAPGAGTVVAPADVVSGYWDAGTETFAPGGSPLNAVFVLAERSVANGNPL